MNNVIEVLLTNETIKSMNKTLTNIKFIIDSNVNEIIISSICNRLPSDKSNIITIKRFKDCWGYKINIENNKEEIIYKSKIHNITELSKAIKTTILILQDSTYDIFVNDLSKIIDELNSL